MLWWKLCLKKLLFNMEMAAILDLGLRYPLWGDVNKYLSIFTSLETQWLNLSEKLLSHFHFDDRIIQLVEVQNVFLAYDLIYKIQLTLFSIKLKSFELSLITFEIHVRYIYLKIQVQFHAIWMEIDGHMDLQPIN